MQYITGVRLVSASATIAALLFGVRGLVGVAFLSLWDLPVGVMTTATVVGGLAGVIVLVAALRTKDRRALAFAVSVVAYALAWWAPGELGAALYFVAEAALVAFGVLTIRSTHGAQRVLGWVVTVAAALWFVASLLTQTVPPPVTTQTFLLVAYSVPGVFQAIAYLAAAVLVAVPLLRSIGAGAGALWSSADVR